MKEKYERIVTFADLRAIGFYQKMGFVKVEEECSEGQKLLSIMENCTYSDLMTFGSSIRTASSIDEKLSSSSFNSKALVDREARLIELFKDQA